MDRLLRFSRHLPRFGAIALSAALFGGCLDFGQGSTAGDGATAESAASLGRYEVTATLVSQSCGTGSLEFPKTLTFAVDLDATSGDALTWGDGVDQLEGKRTNDGLAFTVTAETVVDARAGSTNETAPPCKIERTDVVEGHFDEADAPTSFEAELSVDYAPASGSDCRDLLFGPERLAQALPCKARYELTGERQQ